MMQIKQVILALTLLGFSIFAKATIDLHPFIIKLPEGTQVSFIAKNLNTQQIIAEHQSHIFQLPASTQKVFTALASKLVLSDEFTFKTALLTNSKIDKGTLKGDLIVSFSGDPSLTSEQLYQLISRLKSLGIKNIQGNLILDTSVFGSHDKASGWIWNDLTMCFSAPPAAINIDGNCFYINLNLDRNVGELAKIEIPISYPIQAFSQTYIADKNEAKYCQLDVVVNDNNRYVIKGCLPRQSTPYSLSFAVQDPTSYGATIIQNYLKKLNITLSGRIQQSSHKVKGTLLAEHRSKALPELLKKMMKKSDNQIADSLFRTIAYQIHQRSVSFPLASLTVRNLLHQKANIDFNNSIMVDGSGLSRHNQISAETMLKALEFIAKNETKLKLFDTFPVAGMDGSLSGRGSMLNSPLSKNVIAKTGSLKGVYNLAGFMRNAKGELIVFVQFVNGYFTGELENKTQKGKLIKFESELYNALYNY